MSPGMNLSLSTSSVATVSYPSLNLVPGGSSSVIAFTSSTHIFNMYRVMAAIEVLIIARILINSLAQINITNLL